MSKNEIISLITKKEREAWNLYALVKSEFGANSTVAEKHKSYWAGIYELLQDLNIDERL